MKQLTQDQERLRALVRQIASLKDHGGSPETHPDFGPLEAELTALANKLTAKTT